MEMNKNGVTIDVCPECKGVWLDRGELEKLLQVAREMEREYGEAPRAPAQPVPQYDRPDPRSQPDPRYRRDDDDDDDYRYGKKKKSALGKLFDIFD